MSDDRFQFQPWYIKLWRLRWYLWYPFDAIYCYLYIRWHGDKEPMRVVRSICRGMADLRMNRVVTWEEIKEKYELDDSVSDDTDKKL